MAKKNKERNRKQLRDRMRYLRKKGAEGKATEEEVRELEAFEAAEADPPGGDHESLLDDSPPSPERDDSPADQSGEPAGVQPDPAPAEVGANPITPPAAEPPPPKARVFDTTPPIAPPRPPRVDDARGDDAPRGKRGGQDWKEPYREAAKGAGREATVMFFAERWLGMLQGMSEAIKLAGATPYVDAHSAELKAMVVLTVDEYLPERVQLKPAHMAAFGTTILMGQTFYHRKTIAEKMRQAKERNEFRERREAAAQADRERQEREEAERAAREGAANAGATGESHAVPVAPQDDPPAGDPPRPPPWEKTNGVASSHALAFNPDDPI